MPQFLYVAKLVYTYIHDAWCKTEEEAKQKAEEESRRKAKEEAEQIKSKLEEAGATVEVK